MLANLPAYFESWSHEITSRANRVRNLIGGVHWLSDGVHKEFLVRDFLRRYLPDGLNIERGFIRRLDSDDVSPEIDILIADPARHVPLFREGDLQIVPPSSVLATIEVKSTYRRDVLLDALTNVARARSVALTPGHAEQITSLIMIATAGGKTTLSTIVTDLRSILHSKRFRSSLNIDLTQTPLRECLPTVICVFDLCLIFIECDGPDSPIAVRGFAAGDASAALAFAQLFAALRAVRNQASPLGELDALLERVDGVPVKTTTVSQVLP